MRNWTILAAVAVAASAIATSQNAEACATVTFSPGTVNFAQTWDPINAAQQTITVTATIARTIKAGQTGSPRSVRIILIDNTNEASPVIGTAGPSYQVLNGSANVLFPTGTNISALTSGQSPWTTLSNSAPGDSVSVTLSYVVPANSGQDYVGGTTYTENLSYAVQCNTQPNQSGTNTTGGPASANTVSLTIPKLVSITKASPQTIDFGSFTTTTQNLNVGLKSTSSVNVAVSTARGGQMVLSGAVSPYPSNSVIPYTMTLNGISVANGTNLTNQTRAGVAGTSWPLVLTLTGGLPSGKIAGGYSDTITLTLTPGA